MLFSSLCALVIWGFIQMFFRPGPIGQMIYALLGALIFSGYIVYDTYLLLAREYRPPLTHESAYGASLVRMQVLWIGLHTWDRL